jgi:Fe-S cluster biogenesis protein NfuA
MNGSEMMAEQTEKVGQGTEGDGLRARVEETLNALRPSLQAHGGDVELVDVKDEGQVEVSLVGACHGCPGATMTLRMGIERILKERVPEVTSVEAV